MKADPVRATVERPSEVVFDTSGFMHKSSYSRTPGLPRGHALNVVGRGTAGARRLYSIVFGKKPAAGGLKTKSGLQENVRVSAETSEGSNNRRREREGQTDAPRAQTAPRRAPSVAPDDDPQGCEVPLRVHTGEALPDAGTRPRRGAGG